jgi:hypothetical protein
VGESDFVGGTYAAEWSGGSVVDLGGLPGSLSSIALRINGSGIVVGLSTFPAPPLPGPESSTWAMMLLGFACLGFAGYHRAREQRAAV